MSGDLTAERLLSLRALPVFGMLPISDLQVIARYTTDREFRAGSPLHRANEVLDRIQMLTHGQVEMVGPLETRRVQDAPFAVGVFPVLSQTAVDYETTAVTRVRAVELDGRRLGELFDEYPRLLLHGISQTAHLLLEQVKTELALAVRGSSIESARPPPDGTIDLVERLLFLRQILPLERTSIDAMASVARQLIPLSFQPGDSVWREGDRGDSMFLLIHGELEATRGQDRVQRSDAGALGGIEAFAGSERWYDLRAIAPTDAFVLPIDVLVDAFEDHTDMGLDFLAFLATLIMEANKGKGPLVATPAPLSESLHASEPPPSR